jgi:hypothetical protein
MPEKKLSYKEMNAKLMPIPGIGKAPGLRSRWVECGEERDKNGVIKKIISRQEFYVELIGYWVFDYAKNDGDWIDIETPPTSSMALAVDAWNRMVRCIILASKMAPVTWSNGKKRRARKGVENA